MYGHLKYYNPYYEDPQKGTPSGLWGALRATPKPLTPPKSEGACRHFSAVMEGSGFGFSLGCQCCCGGLRFKIWPF